MVFLGCLADPILKDQATLHEMRLLQLHILKTRKASEGELRIGTQMSLASIELH